MIRTKPYLFILLFLIYFFLTSCVSDVEKLQNTIIQNPLQIGTDNRIVEFLDNLKENDFTICREIYCFSEELQSQIFEYERKWTIDSLRSSTLPFAKTNFSELYTFNHNDWNSSCIVSEHEPSSLINFVIISDNYIGLGFKHGGLVISEFFKAFVIEENTLSDHWMCWIESSKLEDLVSELTKKDLKVLK